MFALHLIAFPLRGRCQPEGAKRVKWLTDEVEKRLKFCFSPFITPAATPHPPRQARHLPLKGKAFKCGANIYVRFIMLSQLLIHRKRSPFSRKRRLNYAVLLAVDW